MDQDKNETYLPKVSENSAKKLTVFLSIVFTLSAISYYFLTRPDPNEIFALGLITSPAIAAIFTQLIFEKSLRGLGWSAKPYRYLFAGYAIPLLYGLVVYVIVWLTGMGIFSIPTLFAQVAGQDASGTQPTIIFLLTYSVKTATLGVLFACITAFGEEVGWRGFLVPELAKRYSFGATALISGIIWSIWHYPAILFVEYNNAGAPLWFGLICFTILVIGISFIMAWLRLKSGSLWPAVLLHASHNAFIQTLFNPLTEKTSISPYVIDEFGVGLAVIVILLGFVIWRKQGNKERLI